MRSSFIELFYCEVCNSGYTDKDMAIACEGLPIIGLNDIKKGDISIILNGKYKGLKGEVIDTFIYKELSLKVLAGSHKVGVVVSLGSLSETEKLYYDDYALSDRYKENKLIDESQFLRF